MNRFFYFAICLFLFWSGFFNTDNFSLLIIVDRHLFSRITGTVYLFECNRKDYEENPDGHNRAPKLNIGLGLKMTKANKEVGR